MTEYRKLTRKQALALFEAGVDVEWKGVNSSSGSTFDWGSAMKRCAMGTEVFAISPTWKDYYRVAVE